MCLLGQTVESMMEIIMMTRNKDMESSHGQMDVVTMVNGIMESSTVKVFTILPRVRSEGVSGKKARGSSGSPKRPRKVGIVDDNT